MTTLREIGEFGLIERLRRVLPGGDAVLVGIGDDCAVLRWGDEVLLVSCDASVEDIHFRRDIIPAKAIGWKAVASALSDIAAMGGRPRFVLITLACPADTEMDLIDALYAGMAAAARESGAVIVGGDTTQSPRGILIDVTVMGDVPGKRYLLREGARAGDVLAVTGALGKSAAGLMALQHSVDAPALAEAHLHPVPRIAEGRWLAEQNGVHAMIDLSDGLLSDAGHLAEAAGLGIDMDSERVPVAPELEACRAALALNSLNLALTGGEEYELIVAVGEAEHAAVANAFAEQFQGPLFAVGVFVDAWQGIRVGGEIPNVLGYDHFQG